MSGNLTLRTIGNSTNNESLVSAAAAKSYGPVYVWFFGYIGNEFYPQYQLNLSQAQVIQVAQNLSETLGRHNLVLLTAVDEIKPPGVGSGLINSTMIPVIKSYVTSLKEYATAVYGRLDLGQFNLTAGRKGVPYPTVYNESTLFLKKLGLSGIWFDNAPEFNYLVGNLTFNKMMQNLTTLYPKAHFILNHSSGKYGNIVQLSGYSWENQTFTSPTLTPSSMEVSLSQVKTQNSLFPGHVLIHMDADGPAPLKNPNEAMGKFANLTDPAEIALLNSMVYNGTHSAYPDEEYSVIYPIIGSWTFPGNPYNETLYNSLSVGNYSRSTFGAFENIMLSQIGKSAVTLPYSAEVSEPTWIAFDLIYRGNFKIA